MNVIHVHYHLDGGGVTRVIQTARKALKSADEVQSVSVFTGRTNESTIEDAVLIPGLSYNQSACPGDVAGLVSELLRRASPSPRIWHFHNATLGKNPAVTAAVQTLILRGECVLNQIHDFAEEGRPENFRVLREFFRGASWWRHGPRAHLAVLNSTHAALLEAVGVPRERAHLLPNPLAPISESPAVGSRMYPGEIVALYPGFPRRRKNVGEALLAAVRARKRMRVLVSNPLDDDWRKFRGRVGSLVESGCSSYSSLVQRADTFFTSSLAEGFGLGFLEPWLVGKGVSGRAVRQGKRDFEQAGIDLSHLYDRAWVDTSRFDENAFLTRWRAGFIESFRAYGCSPPRRGFDIAQAAVRAADRIDFGALDEIAQREVIESEWLQPKEEPSLILGPEEFSVETVAANAAAIRRCYAPEAYRGRVLAIYRQMLAGAPGAESELPVETLVSAFLKPEEFRMLLR